MTREIDLTLPEFSEGGVRSRALSANWPHAVLDSAIRTREDSVTMTSPAPFRHASAALLALLFAVACAASPPPKSQPNPLLSRSMPSFGGKTLSLNEFFSAQGQGHPMVVKFFSAECDRCKESLAALQRIQSDEPNLVVVGISEDDSEATARRLVNGLELHFPVIHDRTGSLAREYHVAQMPATFVITPNGSISWVGGPEQTEDGVRAAVGSVKN